MIPGLVLLLGLQAKAWLRRVTRGVLTVRGSIFMVLGLLAFAGIAISQYQVDEGARDGIAFQRFGPLGLLGLTLLSIFGSSRHRGIYFSPAEIDLLFSAPFTRRQLLGYRIGFLAFQSMLSVLFLTILFFRYQRNVFQGFLGLFLLFLFLTLTQQSVSLLTGTLEERFVARSRKLLGAVLLALSGLVLAALFLPGVEEVGVPDIGALLGALSESWLLFPFRVFTETLAARTTSGFAAWCCGGIAINVALLCLLFGLDVAYQERSLETSRVLHARLRQMRRAGRLPAPSSKLRLALPFPGRLGDAAVLAWRQAQEMLRESPTTVLLLALLGLGGLVPLAIVARVTDETPLEVGPLQLPAFVFLTIIAVNWFRFDFRGDLDRMETLLTLPVSPTALVLGQVVVPTVLLSGLQLVVLGAMLPVSWPDASLLLAVPAVLCAPFNLLFVCLENIFFLLFPVRNIPGSPGDFQNMGRLMFLMLARMLILMVLLAIGGAIALTVHFLTSGSVALALGSATLYLLVLDFLAILALRRAFLSFDVSRIPPG